MLYVLKSSKNGATIIGSAQTLKEAQKLMIDAMSEFKSDLPESGYNLWVKGVTDNIATNYGPYSSSSHSAVIFTDDYTRFDIVAWSPTKASASEAEKPEPETCDWTMVVYNNDCDDQDIYKLHGTKNDVKEAIMNHLTAWHDGLIGDYNLDDPEDDSWADLEETECHIGSYIQFKSNHVNVDAYLNSSLPTYEMSELEYGQLFIATKHERDTAMKLLNKNGIWNDLDSSDRVRIKRNDFDIIRELLEETSIQFYLI